MKNLFIITKCTDLFMWFWRKFEVRFCKSINGSIFNDSVAIQLSVSKFYAILSYTCLASGHAVCNPMYPFKLLYGETLFCSLLTGSIKN